MAKKKKQNIRRFYELIMAKKWECRKSSYQKNGKKSKYWKLPKNYEIFWNFLRMIKKKLHIKGTKWGKNRSQESIVVQKIGWKKEKNYIKMRKSLIFFFFCFQKITSSVEMKDTASSSVKVTYYSSCLGDGPPKQTNKCTGLKVSICDWHNFWNVVFGF